MLATSASQINVAVDSHLSTMTEAIITTKLDGPVKQGLDHQIIDCLWEHLTDDTSLLVSALQATVLPTQAQLAAVENSHHLLTAQMDSTQKDMLNLLVELNNTNKPAMITATLDATNNTTTCPRTMALPTAGSTPHPRAPHPLFPNEGLDPR